MTLLQLLVEIQRLQTPVKSYKLIFNLLICNISLAVYALNLTQNRIE